MSITMIVIGAVFGVLSVIAIVLYIRSRNRRN